MSSLKIALLSALLSALVLVASDAQAQLAVFDVASVTQLIQQARTLAQQLEAARQQLAQAQTLYQSTTGGRGMQLLLSGVTRNYLPTGWPQLSAAVQGVNGGSSALALDISTAISANAVLSAPQIAALPPDQQAQIVSARRSAALLQAVTQEALANSSGRFASIQQLVAAIATTNDQKGILELQARIGAEQGMLQNEQTKLQVLYQLALAQTALDAQREREQVIAGQGSFSSRFEPSPLPQP
jgi:type IV secretion system protein VirB5